MLSNMHLSTPPWKTCMKIPGHHSDTSLLLVQRSLTYLAIHGEGPQVWECPWRRLVLTSFKIANCSCTRTSRFHVRTPSPRVLHLPNTLQFPISSTSSNLLYLIRQRYDRRNMSINHPASLDHLAVNVSSSKYQIKQCPQEPKMLHQKSDPDGKIDSSLFQRL